MVSIPTNARGSLDLSSSGADNKSKETTVARGQWDNKVEFFLSTLGYAVGYGNVWRFPFLCYKNGGAAFLIPYAIMLFVAGFPLFFMELVLGQFSSLGPNILFGKMGPIFQGLGYSMVIISILISIYFNIIFAWSIFYLFASFTSVLPWTSCNNYFNTPNCFIKEDNENCSLSDLIYYNGTCVSPDYMCSSIALPLYNLSHCQSSANVSDGAVDILSLFPRVSVSEDYYRNRVLGVEGKSWDNMGTMRWDVLGCLALGWIIIGACMVKGVKSSGKVVYVTATAPYFILVALLIRGLTLEGAYKGIEFYFLKPNLTKLTEVEVWNDAATQIFYSLGSSAGVLITLSSYNPFKNNCLRDAFMIAASNCLTSVFAGFVIFSILGFMATELDVDVQDVVTSGSGLAFVAYPEAVSKMPVSTLWAILFFVMLITLGIDSQFSYMETIATAVMDQFPNLRSKSPLVMLVITSIMFLCGITMCLEGGVFMFELFVWYTSGISLFIVGTIEILVVHYGYGFDRFMSNIRQDMEIAIPNFMYNYLYVTWKVVTPLSMIIIVIFSIYFYEPVYYGDYTFPTSIQVLGWFLCFSSIICIPIGAILAVISNRKNLKTVFVSEELSAFKRSMANKHQRRHSDTFKYVYDNEISFEA